MKKTALLPLGVLAMSGLLAGSQAYACDFCMLAQGVSPYLTQTGKGLTLGVDYSMLDHVYDKAANIDSQGRQETWLTYTMTGFYPITEDFTVFLTLPYAVKSNVDFDSDHDENTGIVVSGLGDLSVSGRYTVFRQHSLESTLIGGLLFGVKLPTGTTNNRDYFGNPVDRHALPGTGSYDFDLGFNGSYAQASGFQVTFDVDFRLAGDGDWDGRDHRYGNMLNYSLKVYQRVAKTAAGSTFMPFVGLSGETMGFERGVQNDDGTYDTTLANPSTGGTVVLADVGLYSILGPTTMVTASLSKAFYRYLNYDPAFDPDPGENYKLDLSVTYLF
jgi:hypothetical protein